MINTWPEMLAFILKWERMAVTNDPRDPGKQTAGGISRRYNPQARVWTLVDRGVTSGPNTWLLFMNFTMKNTMPCSSPCPRA